MAESEGEKDMEGIFDLTTRQFHGRVLVTTADLIEFAHMEQGQTQGESVHIERPLEMLLSLAHKIIANSSLIRDYPDFKSSY